MLTKKLILSLLLCLSCASAYAIPVKPGQRVVKQPDGTTITVFAHGDEFHHYYTDADGNLVVRNEQGFYAKADNEAVAAHKARALQAQEKHKVRKAGQEINLAPRGLVILVNFKNKAFKYTRQEFDDMLNNEGYNVNGAVGCVREYYEQQSFGQYKPQFDVVGPVTLGNNCSYYGGNNWLGDDQRACQMIAEACKLANNQEGVDFSRYDNDGDGDDNVIKGKRKVKEEIDYKFLLSNTMIPTSGVMVDRTIKGDFRMHLRRGGQDYATWLRLLRDGSKAYGIDEALVGYRIDGESLSSNKLKSVRQIWEIQTQDEKIGKVAAGWHIVRWCWNSVKKYWM